MGTTCTNDGTISSITPVHVSRKEDMTVTHWVNLPGISHLAHDAADLRGLSWRPIIWIRTLAF